MPLNEPAKLQVCLCLAAEVLQLRLELQQPVPTGSDLTVIFGCPDLLENLVGADAPEGLFVSLFQFSPILPLFRAELWPIVDMSIEGLHPNRIGPDLDSVQNERSSAVSFAAAPEPDPILSASVLTVTKRLECAGHEKPKPDVTDLVEHDEVAISGSEGLAGTMIFRSVVLEHCPIGHSDQVPAVEFRERGLPCFFGCQLLLELEASTSGLNPTGGFFGKPDEPQTGGKEDKEDDDKKITTVIGWIITLPPNTTISP